MSGTACSGGVQVHCNAMDKYSSTDYATQCATVTPGYYTTPLGPGDNTGQLPCANGSFCVDGLSTLCQGAAQYQDEVGQSACKGVNVGYFSTPSDGNVNGINGQNMCPIGSVCSNGVEATCPAGSACSGGVISTTCDAVTTYSTLGASTCSVVKSGH